MSVTASEDDGTYLGVGTAELTALGKMCVGYGRIESLVHDVATAVGIDPGNGQLSGLVSEVRKKVVAKGSPPWASASVSEVTRWLDRIPGAAQSRDKLIHAAAMAQARDGEWVQVSQHIRSGELDDDRLGSAMQVIRSFKAIQDDGLTLYTRLLYPYREGVFMRVYRRDGTQPWVVAHGEGGYPARPTSDEFADALARFDAEFPECAPPAD